MCNKNNKKRSSAIADKLQSARYYCKMLLRIEATKFLLTCSDSFINAIYATFLNTEPITLQ